MIRSEQDSKLQDDEVFWDSMASVGLAGKSEVDSPLGKIPDWLVGKKPVSVKSLRLMMFLFVFSIGFVGASSLIGDVSASKFWWKMIVPTICVFNFLLGFFINQMWLVPKLYFQRRFKLFVFFNILYTAFSVGVRDFSIWIFSGESVSFFEYLFGDRITHPIWMGIVTLMVFFSITVIICAFNVLLRLGGIYAQENYIRSSMDKFFLQADLAFLKQQLSPHFLFNTLNNISALVDINPKLAQKSMSRLSTVLRQMLNEAKENEVSLETEIDILEKYCELEKLRFGDNVKFSFHAEVEDPSMKIAPLMMLPLVENAFKYGVHPSDPCHITVFILENGGRLECRVENTLVPKPTSSQTKSGIGLANLKRRLELCYAGRFQYKAESKDGVYIGELKIDLNAKRN